MRKVLLTVLLLFCATIQLWAQPIAYFDSTYSDDGKAFPERGLTTEMSAYLQSPGCFKCVYICGYNDTILNKSNILRMLSDGTELDTSWHSTGIVIPKNQLVERGYYHAQNGKYLGIGKAKDVGEGYETAVWRLLPDGSADTTWNGTGSIVTDFTWSTVQDHIPTGATISSDSITMVSTNGYYLSNPLGSRLLRIEADGTFSNGFDGDGIWDSGLGYTDRIRDVEFRPDGLTYFCGYYTDTNAVSHSYVALIKENGGMAGGAVSFGSGGYMFYPPGDSFAGLSYDRLEQTNDTVIAAGAARIPGFFRYDLMISRFLSDGTPDTSFSGDGYALTNLNAQDLRVEDLVLQYDNKILAAGTLTNNFGEKEFFIARFRPNGDLDSNAISDGIIRVDPVKEIGGVPLNISNLYPLSDGRIVVGARYSSAGASLSIIMRFLTSLEILLLEDDFQSETSSLIVYPNPVRDQLNVQLGSMDGMASFEVYDFMGRQLASLGTKPCGEVQLDLPEGLSPGNYLLRVTTKAGMAWVRWTKE